MSAFGQKRHVTVPNGMSALTPESGHGAAGIESNIFLHFYESTPQVRSKNKLAFGKSSHIFIVMTDILDNAPRTQEEPKLIIRRASHAPYGPYGPRLKGVPRKKFSRELPRKRR